MSETKQEEQLYQRIKTGDEAFLQTLYYEYRDPFVGFLMKYYQADREDALEIYPKSFTTFYFNIRDGKLALPLKSTLKTYLLGIGKHYFHKRYFNKYGQVTDVGLPEHMQWSLSSRPEIVDYFNDEWKARLVADLLNHLGEPCKELLTLSFLKGYSSEALAETMNIPSEGAARRRKSYCLDKLRSLVESSDSFREYLNP